jgi:steroid delta-isomerase-like uncharacterized protein
MVALTAIALAALGAELALAYRAPAATRGDWEAKANEALVARFYAEVWTGGRWAFTEQFVATDHAYRDVTEPNVPVGPAGVAQVVATLRRAFPDLALTLDDVVATGDLVAVRFTARGTHRGTILGAEGSEHVVAVSGVAIHRVVDRQIAETWVSWDTLDLAWQVGLVLVPVSALGGDDGWEGAPSDARPGHPR